MATIQPLKVDEGTPVRESKRIKQVQSEHDAATTKEAQEYYMARLTDKQKLGMMEQSHQEQKQEIRELKSQITASTEMKKDDCKIKEATALAILTLESQLAAIAENKRKDDQETKETVARVAETHKQTLDTKEQTLREQTQEIQDLKSRLAAEESKGCEGCRQSVAAAFLEERDLETKLSVTKRHLAESWDSIAAWQAKFNETKRQFVESRKSNTAWKTELEMSEWRLEESRKSITALRSDFDETQRQLADSQEIADAMKTELDEAEWELAESRKSCVVISDRSLKAQWESTNLKKALADKDRDSWTEIRFRKKFLTRLSTVWSSTFRRRSATFLELVRLATKTDTVSGRAFEHKKRTIAETDYGKTLEEVSSVLTMIRLRGPSTNACVLAWI
jgi:hypothetical protein